MFSGNGFRAGTPVTIRDNGEYDSTVRAREDGSFSREVCFDSASKVGQHRLTAAGTGRGGGRLVVESVVTVTGLAVSSGEGGTSEGAGGSGPRGRSLPRTGADWLLGAAVLGLGLLLAGTALQAAAHRHPLRRRPAS